MCNNINPGLIISIRYGKIKNHKSNMKSSMSNAGISSSQSKSFAQQGVNVGIGDLTVTELDPTTVFMVIASFT